ncbi:ABC transporter ATP-binding protein [Blastopirellula marina]|uniref:Peptide ABC transporter ATP-binding protein n=1 Tax=Blastopirellula marina TaxID=124 RepID=A0A2S8G203_9BACT|nr:ABC transporter ATP-binding protein [Blastopirellula marina]PQO38477.1 peptide ABC transporter ATP-binding protein [Blastopirellula marina]PTL45134.1 ABC transporter ATP-binding protein [Blastopirellula marina]
MTLESASPRNSTASIPLETADLVKTFHQGTNLVKALNGVSLTFRAGEFAAIMGPSGCGKSTLLHVMAGLTRPDSGFVSVEGEKLSSLPDGRLTDFRRRRIGLVFQQFNLITALTALENVMLPLMAEGGRETNGARERATLLLDRLGLGERIGHRPDAMSGGEQQRVAIARALVTDPAIILADEPTGSLDSGNGNAICALLKELNEEEGRTIVMVTHEPAVASWAGRVVVMKDGTVFSDWTADQFPDAQSLALRYQEIVSGNVTLGAV